jgi:calcium permeable stress-gated cation channel
VVCVAYFVRRCQAIWTLCLTYALQIVYEPKVKYHGGDKKPPPISDSILGWVSPLLHTKEPVLVEKIGLDAAIFLRFLRMMRWLFTSIALLVCGVLVPINVVYNLKKVKSSDRDALSMLTIRDVDGPVLFVHAAATYVICFIVIGFIYFNWREVVRLRKQWYHSPEYVQSFYARTLMITQVPKKYQSDEGIRALFESTQAPYPTISVHIGRHVGRLPELVEYHNLAVKELEAVLVKYLKDGKIAKERPTHRLGGFLCCGGRKVDAIDFYTSVSIIIVICPDTSNHPIGLSYSGQSELLRIIAVKLIPARPKTMVLPPWLRFHTHTSWLTCSGRSVSRVLRSRWRPIRRTL